MDILQALSRAQYLSVFDALSGFTQMEFDEESRPITAIHTHRSLHHFKRMPFGWRNGPPEFQRAMQEILSPYLWVFTLVYIDDVMVYSHTFEDHLKHAWGKDQSQVFELVKLALISAPVRGHLEARQAYRLYTDASDYTIAGALQQVQLIAIKDLKGTQGHKRLLEAHTKGEPVPGLSKEHDDRRPTPAWLLDWEETLIPIERVVAYWSRVLAPTETWYSMTEWEALAAKESLVHFQPFIEGERVLLVTDHTALTWAKTYENANRRLVAWGLVFTAYPQLA